MNNQNYGAHEVMEVHEVLTDTINGINQFQLYRPHVNDQQLASILDNQIQFMNQEYNNMVQTINQQGMGDNISYRQTDNFSPKYGLRNPEGETPNQSANQLKDRDIASGMLGCHKASAMLKSVAALECANPKLRRMIQQSANNSSEQAFEIWQYMNEKGYYQVPTMQENTTETVLNSYKPTQPNAPQPNIPTQ